jgi:hypothetical protein
MFHNTGALRDGAFSILYVALRYESNPAKRGEKGCSNKEIQSLY